MGEIKGGGASLGGSEAADMVVKAGLEPPCGRNVKPEQPETFV